MLSQCFFGRGKALGEHTPNAVAGLAHDVGRREECALADAGQYPANTPAAGAQVDQEERDLAPGRSNSERKEMADELSERVKSDCNLTPQAGVSSARIKASISGQLTLRRLVEQLATSP